jgi:hypothetical protein
MVIISPGILSGAFEGLHAGGKLFFSVLGDISGEAEVPNLLVSLFKGVSHSDLTADGARNVSLNVK